MTVVDTSVWVDYFNGRATRATNMLDSLLGRKHLAIGDLIIAEVLQGFRSPARFATAKELLLSFTIHEMLGVDLAIQSAENVRILRRRGITVRSTADVIIATFCISDGHDLLFSDKDFLPFVEHLGLCPTDPPPAS